MSITGTMRTSISGMNAQSSRLGAVAGNIANASTVGFKSANTEFASLVLDSSGANSVAGGVETSTRHYISRQGVLETSSSKFDLAISGNGFMIVADGNGRAALTRAGAFVPDSDGNLVNSAGYTLLGMAAPTNGNVSLPLNSTAGLVPVNIRGGRLEASATTTAAMVANLPSEEIAIAAANLPSTNAGTAISTERSSIVVYGTLGQEITLDIHIAKTATTGAWEVSVFDAAGRSAGGGFPYAAGALATTTLQFDANGRLDAASPTSLALAVPGGAAMDLSLVGATQLATGFVVSELTSNGSPPNDAASLEIAADGSVNQVFGNGTRRLAYTIPLGTVPSPDRLTTLSGNVFETSSGSGDLRIGVAGTGGFGAVISGALENSTVDLASELTEMIEAQRSYTANSKVFQTGAELMEVLVNLKR
jgi:flagellar hook protein FlgE